MVDRWLVFGGWALPPDILSPISGQKSIFIDSNLIMPELVQNDTLATDWQNALYAQIAPKVPRKPFGIAGWSTGALLAFTLANRIEPDCAVCISATPSFCRRPGFPHGQKSSILKAMRGQLALDTGHVLNNFYSQCGIDNNIISRIKMSPYDRQTLIAGLHFLEQAVLFPATKLPCPSLFLHGRSDTIIPIAAGKKLCLDAGGSFAEFDGPHAFFINQYDKISEFIKNNFI